MFKDLANRIIKPFPITLFSIVMGLSGLVTVYEKVAFLFEAPPIIYEVLLGITSALLAIIFGLYALKVALYTDEVKAELYHPIKINFFSAIPISFLLISISWYNEVNPLIGIVLWYAAAPVQLLMLLFTFGRWIRHDHSLAHANPAWFIPIVGTILIPVVGVDIAPLFVSIFFFSIGLFFWIIFFTIILYRLIFHDTLQTKFIPTLFIFIAPPAVGLISYVRLTGQLDLFGYVLYSLALFLVLLLLSMAPHFKMPKFFISWWAYTFPLDAAALSSMLLYELTREPLFAVISVITVTLATLVIAYISWATLKQLVAGQLLVED